MNGSFLFFPSSYENVLVCLLLGDSQVLDYKLLYNMVCIFGNKTRIRTSFSVEIIGLSNKVLALLRTIVENRVPCPLSGCWFCVEGCLQGACYHYSQGQHYFASLEHPNW